MVGIFIASLNGGGAERVVVNLVNELHSRGFNVVLILRYKKGEYLKEVNPGVKVVELDADSPFGVVFRLIQECKKYKVSTLLSVTRYMNVLALIANTFLKIRLIIREANTLDEFFHDYNFIDKIKYEMLFFLMNNLYKKSDAIIANSKDTSDDLKKYLIGVEKKISIIHNPLELKRIQKLSTEALPEHFIKLSSPKIISVGRLVYQKNFELLINAFAIVKKCKTDANLIILGKGPLKQGLIELTQQLNIKDSVHFLGFVRNPYKYLNGSDLFVLSSRFEGFGNVLVEALAVGLPIVSTNCAGGPKEILNRGEFGEIVPLDNEDTMAKVILEVLNTSTSKERQIERANDFSIDKITDQYLKVLLENNEV